MVNSLCTGTMTSSSVPTGVLARWSHSPSLQVGCLSTPHVTSYWPASLTLTRTEARSFSHHQEDDRSSCCWRRPMSATTSARNTSGRSTSTATKGSRSLPGRGTTRRISNRRRSAAVKIRRWYIGINRARSSPASGWIVSKSLEST